jgi:hypothetical protein
MHCHWIVYVKEGGTSRVFSIELENVSSFAQRGYAWLSNIRGYNEVDSPGKHPVATLEDNVLQRL